MAQPVTIYENVQQSTQQTTVTDVLLGAVGVVLGLAVVAVVLGLVCAVILIRIRRARGGRPATTQAVVTQLGLDAHQDFPRGSTVSRKSRA